jgi:hypothetical protein
VCDNLEAQLPSLGSPVVSLAMGVCRLRATRTSTVTGQGCSGAVPGAISGAQQLVQIGLVCIINSRAHPWFHTLLWMIDRLIGPKSASLGQLSMSQ